MKKFFAIVLVAVVCFAIGFSAAQAAVINVDLVASNLLDSTTFEPIAGASFSPKSVPNQPGPVVIEFQVLLTVESLAAGEDSFGHAAFAMEVSGATPTAAYGGRPFPNVDTNGAPPPGATTPLFAQNADLGVSSEDYLGILVQMATGAFTNASDPRRNVGEATGITLPTGEDLSSGVWIGNAYALWDGSTPGSAFLRGPNQGDPVQVSAKDAGGQFVAGTSILNAPVIIGIPEPGTLALAGLSLIGLVLRRNG